MTLDAAHPTALDATVLEALRELLRAVQARGGTLSTHGLGEQPFGLLALSGLAPAIGADRVTRALPGAAAETAGSLVDHPER